ncbi:MAG TPA: choice-of-anchor D domain-containing protein [Candidatus Binataceae bacterium]|nr:choice-of-anchor D domain-containing protein [Candidatus Binataceae bacterium]
MTPTPTATATQTATPTPTATATATTTLTAMPAKLSFGRVDVSGTSAPKKVTLTNKGKAPAQISNVTAAAPFLIAGGANTCTGQTIAVKKTCSFDVEFAPAAPGKVAGGIDVAYNGASPTLVLRGDGIAAAAGRPKSASSGLADRSSAGPVSVILTGSVK